MLLSKHHLSFQNSKWTLFYYKYFETISSNFLKNRLLWTHKYCINSNYWIRKVNSSILEKKKKIRKIMGDKKGKSKMMENWQKHEWGLVKPLVDDTVWIIGCKTEKGISRILIRPLKIKLKIKESLKQIHLW
jgi:hypothetical protein